MSLRIRIVNGDVVTWEYRANPPPPEAPPPAIREPIRLMDPQREAGPLPALVALALFGACVFTWCAIAGG